MIKTLLTITLLIFNSILFTDHLTAQHCHVEDDQVQYDNRLLDGVKVRVTIPMEDLKQGFNDYVKEKFDVNLQGYGFLTRKDEVSTDFFNAPTLSDEPINIIGLFREDPQETVLILIAQKEDESFLDAANPSFKSLRVVGSDFLEFYVPQFYNSILEEANDQYGDAQKELSKTRDDLEKDQEDLIKLKEEIIELENSIMETKREIINLESELDKSRNQVAQRKADLQKAMEALSQINR